MLLDTRWNKVRSKSILIVDDDATIQDSIREILELEGYCVDTAGNGREAMEKYNTYYYNLAFLDVKLPDTEGTELLRRLLQGHLDVRAANETRQEAVTGADGVIRNHCRKDCRRDVMSLFGEVSVRRLGYSARGHRSLFVLDGELNLPVDKYSHGLRRRIAEEVAKNSFDEAVASIGKTTGGRVAKRQVEEVSAKIAQDFEAFYERRRARNPDGKNPSLRLR